jgi:hypothetical protein
MSSWGGEADGPRVDGRGAATRRGDAADDKGVIDANVIDTAVIEAVVIDVGDAGAGAAEADGTPSAGDGASRSPRKTAPPDPVEPSSATTATAELVLWEGPVPGDDPLPSTGSLKWAPDPTEPLASVPPALPAVRSGPSIWPDPPGPGGPSFGSGPPGPSGPSGWAGPPALVAPPGQADPGEPARHRAQGPRRPGGDHATRRWQSDRQTLVGLGVLVAFAVVAAMLMILDGGGSTDAGESAAPSTTLVVGDGSDPAGPIVGPTGVIGSWSGTEWLPRPDGDQPGAEHDYAVVGLTDAVGTARGEAVAEDCAAQRASSQFDVAVDLDAGSGPPPIAVAGVAEPRPRAIEHFGTDADVYRQAAVDVAAGLGATQPPTLTQVLRTDLDGDGGYEVVVAAGHISDPEGLTPADGDWSVVFLRRLVSDGVATDVLASSVAGNGDGLDHIEVATLADLNGDGTMEVALAGRSSNGEWTSIHALGSDGVPSEVLRAGCEG